MKDYHQIITIKVEIIIFTVWKVFIVSEAGIDGGLRQFLTDISMMVRMKIIYLILN